jgi:hypothetical protein
VVTDPIIENPSADLFLGRPAWKATLITALVMIGVSLIAVLIDVSLIVVNRIRMLWGTGHLETALPPGPGIVSGLLGLPGALLYFVGGASLLFHRWRVLIAIAAVVGMIPFLSFDCTSGNPLGLWILFLLTRPGVRKLFWETRSKVTAS